MPVAISRVCSALRHGSITLCADGIHRSGPGYAPRHDLPPLPDEPVGARCGRVVLPRPLPFDRPRPPVGKTPRPFPYSILDTALDIQGPQCPACSPHIQGTRHRTLRYCRRIRLLRRLTVNRDRIGQYGASHATSRTCEGRQPCGYVPCCHSRNRNCSDHRQLTKNELELSVTGARFRTWTGNLLNRTNGRSVSRCLLRGRGVARIRTIPHPSNWFQTKAADAYTDPGWSRSKRCGCPCSLSKVKRIFHVRERPFTHSDQTRTGRESS